MPPVKLFIARGFVRRYRSRFVDPTFSPLQDELDALSSATWDAYGHSRKSTGDAESGEGFAVTVTLLIRRYQ